MAVDFLGTQWTAELYGCDASRLDDVDGIRALMLAAADVAHATIVGSQFHRFSPWGVSGVVVIAESHLAIHTWPEHGYAALDVFSCGATLHADAAFRFLAEALGATHVDAARQRRGAPHRIGALRRPTPEEPSEAFAGLIQVSPPVELAAQIYELDLFSADGCARMLADETDATLVAMFDEAVTRHLGPIAERLWRGWRHERTEPPIRSEDRPGGVVRTSRGAGDVAVIVTLNDDFAGGGTRFARQELLVGAGPNARIGSAVLFPSGLAHAHAALPVTAGVRCTLTGALFGRDRGDA